MIIVEGNASDANETALHEKSNLVAEINPTRRVTLLQSMNQIRLVRPKFKQLHRSDC
jgi:hypothetical protein